MLSSSISPQVMRPPRYMRHSSLKVCNIAKRRLAHKIQGLCESVLALSREAKVPFHQPCTEDTSP